MLSWLKGRKTYVTAIGYALWGVTEIIAGATETGMQKVGEAFMIIFLRQGVSKATR